MKLCKHFQAPCSCSPGAPSDQPWWSAVLCFCKNKTENLCNYLWSRRRCAAWQNSVCRKLSVISTLTNFPTIHRFFSSSLPSFLFFPCLCWQSFGLTLWILLFLLPVPSISLAESTPPATRLKLKSALLAPVSASGTTTLEVYILRKDCDSMTECRLNMQNVWSE